MGVACRASCDHALPQVQTEWLHSTCSECMPIMGVWHRPARKVSAVITQWLAVEVGNLEPLSLSPVVCLNLPAFSERRRNPLRLVSDSKTLAPFGRLVGVSAFGFDHIDARFCRFGVKYRFAT
ncbi:hypothetical protein O9992_20850 [Vibrio lentus]|nr:hypothetical protein [Vibrio lentus]